MNPIDAGRDVVKYLTRKSREELARFSYELAPFDYAWLGIGALLLAIGAFVFPVNSKFQIIFIGALSSYLVYVISLVAQERKNVEGPRGPLVHSQHAKDIESAKGVVFVYVTFLNSISCHSDDAKSKGVLRDALVAASRKKIEIKFMILSDQAHEAIKARSEQLAKLGMTEDKMTGLLRQNLWTLYCFARYEGINLEVCRYFKIPQLSILQVDSRYSIAPYEEQFLSDTPRFDVHRDGALGKIVTKLLEDARNSETDCQSNRCGWRHEVMLDFPSIKSDVSFPFVMVEKQVFAVWINEETSGEHYKGLPADVGEVAYTNPRFGPEYFIPTGRALYIEEKDSMWDYLKEKIQKQHSIDIEPVRFLSIGKIK